MLSRAFYFLCFVFGFLISNQKIKSHPKLKATFYCSISSSSELKISSSKNSVRVISKPLASIITVLKVTVLFRPFIIHCILPCCIPDFCSKRYWEIPFSRNNLEIRFATALFTVKSIPSLIRRFNSVVLPTHLFYQEISENIRSYTYIVLTLLLTCIIICRCTCIEGD